jgi:nucleotidyltransferase substrate binding protein (TIGR01987 family)
MADYEEIRWRQRFSNFLKALNKLHEAVQQISDADKKKESENIDLDQSAFWDDIIKEGLIQRFEYTHELAWKVMKDFLAEKGAVTLYGSKDATKEAFSSGLIEDGEVWMEMIKSRNLTSHTYNEDTADEIFTKIINDFHPAFIHFRETMKTYIPDA